MSNDPCSLSTPREADAGVSRRRFLHGAALAVAALATPTVFGQNSPSATPAPTPVNSLSGPAAPPLAETGPLASPDKQPPHLEIAIARKKLGWAVVGLGQLAIEEILPAFASCKNSRLTALVSGHRDKAKKIAAVHNLSDASIYGYTEFNRIHNDPDVNIVYIVLPNSMHAEFTVRGLQAGKHVLCEKPMACTGAECEAMIAASAQANRKLKTQRELSSGPQEAQIFIDPVDQFAAEMDAFSMSILSNEPVATPGEMGLRDIRIVLAVLESARLGGQPVKVG